MFTKSYRLLKVLNSLRKILVELNFDNINPTKWTTDDDKNDQIKTIAS